MTGITISLFDATPTKGSSEWRTFKPIRDIIADRYPTRIPEMTKKRQRPGVVEPPRRPQHFDPRPAH